SLVPVPREERPVLDASPHDLDLADRAEAGALDLPVVLVRPDVVRAQVRLVGAAEEVPGGMTPLVAGVHPVLDAHPPVEQLVRPIRRVADRVHAGRTGAEARLADD